MEHIRPDTSAYPSPFVMVGGIAAIEGAVVVIAGVRYPSSRTMANSAFPTAGSNIPTPYCGGWHDLNA